MEEDLIFIAKWNTPYFKKIMLDDVNFKLMEDKLNFFNKMEDDLFFLTKWKTTFFFNLKTTYIFQYNIRWPQFVNEMEAT